MACEEEPGKPTSMVSQKKSRKQKRGWKITATLDVLLSVVVFFSFSTCALSLSPNTFSSKYTIHKKYIYIRYIVIYICVMEGQRRGTFLGGKGLSERAHWQKKREGRNKKETCHAYVIVML